MKTAIRILLYAVIVMAVYIEEYDVPVMMYVKRARFLADWKLAALMQRKALKSYHSYREEAEYTRG